MNKLTVSASPHITQKTNSTRRIMLDVIIALMPAVIAATLFFGYHVIINVIFCIVFCVGAELLFGLITRKKFDKEGVRKSSIWDGSAIVTAIILALNIPSKMNVWGFNIENSAGDIALSFDTIIVCLIGSIVAICLVKMLFGGIGKNFANPAATARIFLFVAFGLFTVQSIGALGFEASTGATWLGNTSAQLDSNSILKMFIGNTGSAAVGETSVIAILIGYIYLSIRKVIDFRTPLIIIASTAVFMFLFKGLSQDSEEIPFYMLAQILSGGLVFGAVFMATDYASSPNTFKGQLIFAIGIGLITSLIRAFASYPEGVSFAIVIMNIASPLIDKLVVPKPFGYTKPIKDKTVKEPQKMKLNKNNNTEKNSSEVSV